MKYSLRVQTGNAFDDQQLLPVLGEGSSAVPASSLASRAIPGNLAQPGAPSLPVYAGKEGLYKADLIF